MNEEETRAYQQQYFREHKDRIYAQNKIRTAERRQKIHEWLEAYKQGKVCQRCGIADPRLLEFRYKNAKTGKEANLKNIAISAKWTEKRIQQELEKSTLLCWNCRHRLE